MDIFTSYDPDAITPLCGMMYTFGSDKGDNFKQGWHNYTTYYHSLFKKVRYEPLAIFELGLGTNFTDISSNMGLLGKPGASLRGWRAYFPNAQIYGADIDTRILFQEDRIQTFACDQTNSESIETLWSNPALPSSFDILLEDGLHMFEANVFFFEHSIHKLKPGGIYIIEDINTNNLSRMELQISLWKTRWPHLEFRLLSIPHENTFDNSILIVQAKA